MRWPLTLPPRPPDGFDVAVFGENSLDVIGVGEFPRNPSSASPRDLDKTTLTAFAMLPGGQAATAAVGCARQGVRTRYVGATGDDESGWTVVAALEKEGLDVMHVVQANARSRSAIVLVDADSGARTVHEFRDPRLSVPPAMLSMDDLLATRLCVLDATDLPASRAIARAARARGIPTMLDVDQMVAGIEELLESVSVVSVPESFLASFTGAAGPSQGLEHLTRRCPATVLIVTLGAGGSLTRIGVTEIATPAFTVDVIDTTGAGDAFRAGLASAWVLSGAGALAEHMLLWANASAALNCQGLGAQTALPTRAEVDRLVTGATGAQSK